MGANKTLASTIGAILLLVGLLGFFMTSPLLGLFEVNTTHNIVHLLTGAIFLWAGMAAGGANAKATNKWLGIVYLLVAILGIFGALTFLAIPSGFGDADNLLHLVLGVVLVWAGFKAE